jgi:hypothetical protein
MLLRAGLALAPLLGLGAAFGSELKSTPSQPAPKSAKPAVPADKKDEGGCAGHGTSIDFYDTPSEAAALAKKSEKLVFVLHVSGNFEDPRFT